ncbi:DUF2505 domain-containing protein [Saccharomonospora xinjiangensis]|uniref:DUF2505 domain-containing protein n=1 Tax=Saccharomonospora xinjiangensis TaxID=75294 RepID=UPI00106F5138|nr:DUF2505 domain-containing protein [Saccharomonospora xinjiangensis]QBQ58691.1 hypothetical protein EYD13_01520 [Saccharomonospora xinjiangensis]
MATRIDHRATFTSGAEDAYAAQTEEQALLARLELVGGEHAELRDHQVTEHGARYTLLQAVPSDKLPSLVRTLRSGDLTVRRTHVWNREGDRFTGTVTVEVADIPGRITADVELAPSGAGSVQTTRGEVSVRVPFVGGKIESFVVDQVTRLLESEARATEQWLAR